MSAETGWIHSIDTFSALDGPGIRTVIYFQGCLLRCVYCHNPDTWPLRSPEARPHTTESILQILRRNRPYYASSGGLTCSGGEPLLQADFIARLLRQCQREGIHTAIDSALYVPPAQTEKILPYTNLVLADIKHIDPQSSQRITGFNNDHNLANLKLLAENRIPVWLRYVVVPGLTDQTDVFYRMAALINRLPNIERMDLLPYHGLGEHRWALLGLPYSLSGAAAPAPERLQQLKAILRETVSPAIFIP
jgi:pyruvate formate lyase activating enzyme